MSIRGLVRSFATAVQVHPALSDVVHLPLTAWPSSSASTSSNETSYVELPSHVFGAPSRPDILHQCVVAHLAGLRQGTAANKNRAQVRGSGRKIMRQKGTGKARVGDAYSPIRRGGGRAFPKIPKDWSLGLNRKVWEMGVRTALSERWRRGDLVIIPDPPVFPQVSTRELKIALDSSSITSWEKSLFLLSEIDDSFQLSARNMPGVNVKLVDDIDVYSVLQGNRIVLDMAAVQFLEDWLGRRGQNFEDEVAEVEELLAASDINNPDGGVKEHDVVIEQEEAPVREQREQEDPLKDKGNAIREQMEDLSKQSKDKVGPEEDRPSPKDVL